MSIVKYTGAMPQLDRETFIHSIDSKFDDIWNQVFPEFGKAFGVDVFEKQSYPKINAIDYSDRVEIEAAVPGLSKEDVNIEFSDGTLTISGEKKQSAKDENVQYIYRELKRSSFKRSFNVDPSLLDAERITASFKDGILTISIPKVKPIKKEVKKINIS